MIKSVKLLAYTVICPPCYHIQSCVRLVTIYSYVSAVLPYTVMCPPCYYIDGKTAHGNTVDNYATKLRLGESKLNYLPDLYTCNIC